MFVVSICVDMQFRIISRSVERPPDIDDFVFTTYTHQSFSDL